MLSFAKCFPRALAALACGLALTACTRSAEPAAGGPVKVTIGYGLTSDTLAAHVARKEGIFARNGIDATLLPVGANSSAGLFSGSLQMVMSNPAALLTAVNGGLDFVVVASGPRTTTANDPIGLIVRPDVAYARPQDLEGKRMAVPSFDSGMYFLLKKWLSDRHVDASRIQFVESSMSQMGALLSSRRVEAVVTVEPFRSKIERDGFGRVVVKYYTQVIPDQPTLFWVSTRTWADKNPATVAAIQKSLREAADFIAAHPEQARALELEIFKTNRATLPNNDTRLTAADLETYYRVGQSLGVYAKPIDTSRLIAAGVN